MEWYWIVLLIATGIGIGVLGCYAVFLWAFRDFMG